MGLVAQSHMHVNGRPFVLSEPLRYLLSFLFQSSVPSRNKTSHAVLNHLDLWACLGRMSSYPVVVWMLCFPDSGKVSKLSLWSAVFQISPDTPEQRRVIGKGCGLDFIQHMASWRGTDCRFCRYSHPCYFLHRGSKNFHGNHTFSSKPIFWKTFLNLSLLPSPPLTQAHTHIPLSVFTSSIYGYFLPGSLAWQNRHGLGVPHAALKANLSFAAGHSTSKQGYPRWASFMSQACKRQWEHIGSCVGLSDAGQSICWKTWFVISWVLQG